MAARAAASRRVEVFSRHPEVEARLLETVAASGCAIRGHVSELASLDAGGLTATVYAQGPLTLQGEVDELGDYQDRRPGSCAMTLVVAATSKQAGWPLGSKVHAEPLAS